MKFEVTLHAPAGTSEHKLELGPSATTGVGGGQVEFRLDAEARGPQSADWAEVSPGVYSIILGGRSYEARVAPPPGSEAGPGTSYRIAVGTRDFVVEMRDPRLRRRTGSARIEEGPQEIRAPMPGRIAKVLVSEGQRVEAGDGLVVIEAMKMQNEMRAPRSGRVQKIYVVEGEGVETGFKLLHLV